MRQNVRRSIRSDVPDMNDVTAWTAARAREHYNVERWGEGYVDVTPEGHVAVRPHRDRSPASIDLFELAQRLPREGLALPVLVRFNNILHDRVDALTGAFAAAIQESGYRGHYTAVYPIKVNQ